MKAKVGLSAVSTARVLMELSRPSAGSIRQSCIGVRSEEGGADPVEDRVVL